MKITRGTTPTVSLKVTDYELLDTDTIHLYFSQNKKMRLKKVSPDVTIDGQYVRVTLTQEETFKLKKDEEVTIRFRLKRADGTILPSGEVIADIDDVDDNDEVI